MWLFTLLLIPTIVMIFSMVTSKGRFTLKEFILAEVLMVMLMLAGYAIAKHQSLSDTEIWNGWLMKAEFYEEWWERVSCRHPISCSHYDEDGNTIHSNDGYYHFYDVDYNPPYWEGYTSNGETISLSKEYFDKACVFFENKNYEHVVRSSLDHGKGNKYVTEYKPGGELGKFIPTAVPHSFYNYIKANSLSVIKKTNDGDKFKDLIPVYPKVNESEWTADRFISKGINIPQISKLNKWLSEVNSRLGRDKQVNVIIIVVSSDDPSYADALEEKWLGGKKNDFVVVIGSTSYPKIDWVRTMSWSLSEDLKVELRNAIQYIETLEKSEQIISLVESGISQKFKRRSMADFKYLMAGWQPSSGVMISLIIIGFIFSIFLSYHCVENDIFNEERSRWR